MPMIKKRRKSDKKKRRNLFKTNKITEPEKPVENVLSEEQPKSKKTKNSLSVEIQVEEFVQEKPSTEKLKRSQKSVQEIKEEEPITQSAVENIDEVKAEETSKSKPLKKTKQRY